jgi:hypothetical protein
LQGKPNAKQVQRQELVVLQHFKDDLIDAILVGERALMYAFGFNFNTFEAHHLLMKDTSSISKIRHVPPGQFCVRVAWELLEQGCDLFAQASVWVYKPCLANQGQLVRVLEGF